MAPIILREANKFPSWWLISRFSPNNKHSTNLRTPHFLTRQEPPSSWSSRCSSSSSRAMASRCLLGHRSVCPMRWAMSSKEECPRLSSPEDPAQDTSLTWTWANNNSSSSQVSIRCKTFTSEGPIVMECLSSTVDLTLRWWEARRRRYLCSP